MAAVPNSIGISGGIAPFDENDTYSTHYSKFGLGGYRAVDLFTDLASIPLSRLGDGEPLVYVKELKLWYFYLDDAWVIAPFSSNQIAYKTLEANLTLTSGDNAILHLDPNGAPRNVYFFDSPLREYKILNVDGEFALNLMDGEDTIALELSNASGVLEATVGYSNNVLRVSIVPGNYILSGGL